jgi:hypothetical protein
MALGLQRSKFRLSLEILSNQRGHKQIAERSTMLELSGFQVALILLGGVWGALGITVNIFSILNERRDLVLRITERKARLSTAQEMVLFYNDWIPLWIGSCLFLAFVSSMFYLLPDLITCKANGPTSLADPQHVREHIRVACRLATALAGFGFIADVTSGVSDIRSMRSAMGNHLRAAKSLKSRPFPRRHESAKSQADEGR